ncbi:thioredoxin family protein [Haliovirga abyssi]|uniref:Thioredoxin family protein n=1 Tax=Haliovirga abyssi TaxID=2996794 RepID=A0AAU9DMZ6_9FUSO|nr:thioredoxin family protein [Haliovirga abyssi]BDU49693.1 hypothetical protein HLVA_02620 [Haliovirga abyssi]
MEIKNGMDYEGYLNSSLEEYKEKQIKVSNFIKLEEKIIEKLKEIKSEKNILVFAETYCPDSREVMAVLNEMKKYVKINLYIFPRKDNEDELKKITGYAKIPTLIKLDESKKITNNYFIEFPEKFRAILKNKSETEIKNKIHQFRRGEYNHLIVEEIINKMFDA